ncbi:hypothetical protein D3C72_468090 [compost metagenome]
MKKKKVQRDGYFQRQQKKFRENVREKRPEHKAFIESKIQDALQIATTYDPFDLLRRLALANVFVDPEEYKESTHGGKEYLLEYALSLITSIRTPSLGHLAPDEVHENFSALLEQIYSNTMWYFASEIAEEKLSDNEYSARFYSILKSLYLRGDSIYEHHVDLVKALFSSHDVFLKSQFGFAAEEIISTLQGIESQVIGGFSGPPTFALLAGELHEEFKDFLKSRGLEKFDDFDNLKQEFFDLPEVAAKKAEIDAALARTQDDVWAEYFRVVPSEAVSQNLLDLISIELGGNAPFAEFAKSPAWPTNDSQILFRPLIRHQGEYYAYSPQILFRNTINIIEALIQARDKRYFDEKYQPSRASLLEERGIAYFQAMLPGIKVFRNLYYGVMENGQKKRPETDAILLYDGNLFIIEAKAGSISKATRRGALKSLKTDTTNLIGDAYEQALRAKKYIDATECPRFEYRNGDEAFTIYDKDEIHSVYLVNLTLENLNQFSMRLSDLKDLGFVRGHDWLWSVFINDLRIISELIDSPSEFLLYLRRRLRSNDYPQFRASDELDLLMYFFDVGLFLENSEVSNYSYYSIGNYTEALDRFYDFKAGRVSSGEKPRLKTSDEFREFIHSIELSGQTGFSRVTTFLLDLSGECQTGLLKKIKQIETRLALDGNRHDCTILIKEPPATGLSVFLSLKQEQLDDASLDEYVKLKMYQTRTEHWYTLAMLYTKKGVEINFKYHEAKWAFDAVMQEKLYQFAKANKRRRMLEAPIKELEKYFIRD